MKLRLIVNCFLSTIFILFSNILEGSERLSLTQSTPNTPTSNLQSARSLDAPRPFIPHLRLSTLSYVSPRNSPRTINPPPGLSPEQKATIEEINQKEIITNLLKRIEILEEQIIKKTKSEKSFHNNHFPNQGISSHELPGQNHFNRPLDFNNSSQDPIWEIIIREVVKMNQPLTAAGLTLLFYIISNKELMANAITFFNENIKDKLKDLTQQIAWSNVINNFMPYFAKRNESLKEWLSIGIHKFTTTTNKALFFLKNITNHTFMGVSKKTRNCI